MSGIVTTLGFALIASETRWIRPDIASAVKSLRSGASLFFFRSAASLYTTGNVLLFGVLAPAPAVGYFAAAEKLAKATLAILNPLVQTFYPRISHELQHDPEKARRTAGVSAILTIGTATVTGAILFAFAPEVVRILLGRGYEESAILLQWLSALVPMVAASNLLGIQWMLPLRMEKQLNAVIVSAGLLNLGLASTLAPLCGALGMAWSVLGAEAFVTVAIYACLRRRKKDPWNWKVSVEAGLGSRLPE